MQVRVPRSAAPLALALAAALAPPAARAQDLAADAPAAPTDPAPEAPADIPDGEAAPAYDDLAAAPADDAPGVHQSVDDSTGYFVMFTIAATFAELVGGAAIGFGAAELDRADRIDRLPARAVPDLLPDEWSDPRLEAGLAEGIGILGLGLGLALDLVIAGEWSSADDWWVRPCLTTPVAAFGAAMLAAGASRLTFAEDLRGQAGSLPSVADRETLRAEASDADVTGRVLLSLGAGAVVAAAAAFLLPVLYGEEDDDGGTAAAPRLLPTAFAGGGGLELRLAL